MVVFLLAMILSACSNLDQNKVYSNQTRTLESNTQNDALPKTNINGSEGNSVGTIIKTLSDNREAIHNEALSKEQRKISSLNYIENLEKFLNLRESTKYSDQELRKTLGDDVVSKTTKVNISGREIDARILRYDGLSELFGTLARRWTYIQWWDDKKVMVQCLDKKGADVVNDLIVLKAKDRSIMLLAGYQTSYYPPPVFLSSWEFNGDKWIEVDLFKNNISSEDTLKITKYENRISVEGKDRIKLTVEQNQQRDGFVVYSEADKKKREFRLSGEQIVMN
jgi:hypothetical protein